MKHLISFFLLCFTLISPIANAEQTHYISDNLFTYLLKGPGSQYRIVGSVNAGSPVTLLEKDNGYSRITDTKGRTGWIESKFISTDLALQERLPVLETELTTVKAKLVEALSTNDNKHSDLNSALAQRNSQINTLETRNTQLQNELTIAQDEVRSLRAKIDTQKDDLLMKWFTYGGLVAGVGLLLGLLLPHITPRRRKRTNGWA
ncbi:TIGR04211 family SH3 domain-containing protein [Photobacterium carnosum]|uniref:TIGR04211 family SH3 domain-containing protein n=1 Tax=Photobacterium carnosum TaxID=2023717 RepID=UPI001E51F222|nr:TIGR04211 family SH3 domain-containing protein [Photobacterium carnosum]MCD9499711.1 SH3 domain-containing protein [Photobacterium carnosum]MCD9515210.1 SH3 domain-containing protein [Photobacterium carnosum]MCD9530249.1 SH3 domain-containing protein [Photobacterium carnosum]MCD9537960.1 SH3 domain-containing protein [Photobacterium carnosum]MCD9545747.1 SH3 domain-containing protein [Photobacterium carnosum]